MTREERKRYKKWLRLWKASRELLFLARKYHDLGIFSLGWHSIMTDLAKYSESEVEKFKQVPLRGRK